MKSFVKSMRNPVRVATALGAKVAVTTPLCLALAGLFVAGCGLLSFKSSPSSASVRLSADAPWSVVELQKDPYLYRISDPSGNATGFYFATALHECGVRRDRSLVAVTRQLLVGLRDISMLKQHVVDTADGRGMLVSLLDAKLDDANLRLAINTMERDGCLLDLVLWGPRPEGVSSELPAEDLQRIANWLDAHTGSKG